MISEYNKSGFLSGTICVYTISIYCIPCLYCFVNQKTGWCGAWQWKWESFKCLGIIGLRHITPIRHVSEKVGTETKICSRSRRNSKILVQIIAQSSASISRSLGSSSDASSRMCHVVDSLDDFLEYLSYTGNDIQVVNDIGYDIVHDNSDDITTMLSIYRISYPISCLI